MTNSTKKFRALVYASAAIAVGLAYWLRDSFPLLGFVIGVQIFLFLHRNDAYKYGQVNGYATAKAETFATLQEAQARGIGFTDWLVSEAERTVAYSAARGIKMEAMVEVHEVGDDDH